MASRNKNPKKNPAARRRRPTPVVLRRAQLRLDDIAQLLSGASPEALPLLALPCIWLWNMAQDGHAAAHCVEACLTLQFALADYGIGSDVQAVAVQVNTDRVAGTLYDHDPYYNTDGSFNGHAILVVPDARRLIDATVQQFGEVPQTARATLPIVAGLPAATGLGTDAFGVVRREYTVAYRAFPAPQRYAWRTPRIETMLGQFREAGGNLASNVFDLLRQPAYRERAERSPYPRLRTLLAALGDTVSVVEGGRYLFADPVTGAKRTLADVI